jgi:hypothetical protein
MDNDAPAITIRHYGLSVGDYQVISGWYHERHGRLLPETILPPLGVMVEDSKGPAAVLFAYQSLGIGVAFLDPFITRPGMPAGAAHHLFGWALAGIELVLKREDYGFLRCFTESDTLARCLMRHGFTGENNNLAKLIA